MTLLLQLDGELPDRFPGHERRIHVFACRATKCRRKPGSVRAIRGVRVSKAVAEAAREAERKETEERRAREERERKERERQAGLGSALFGGGAAGAGAGVNPFSAGGGGGNPFSSGAANPFSAAKEKTEEVKVKIEETVSELPKTFAETLSLNNPQPETKSAPPPAPEPWPEASTLPSPFPNLYLVDVDYETLDPTPPALPANAQVEMEEPTPGGASNSKDDFESTMDADFQEFADRMSQNPEQVIRYEFGGQPLLYTKEDAAAKAVEKGLPRCGGCGGARVFELQLTPQAIAELEADEMGLEGMDWGTVIVGVCEKDCQAAGVGDGEVGYVEEWVGVQWEELVS